MASREETLARSRRAHRLLSVGGNVEAADYADLVLRFDPCAYCGGEWEAVDHIVARPRSDEWDNLTAACRSCNSRKSAKPLLFFLAQKRLGLGPYQTNGGTHER